MWYFAIFPIIKDNPQRTTIWNYQFHFSPRIFPSDTLNIQGFLRAGNYQQLPASKLALKNYPAYPLMGLETSLHHWCCSRGTALEDYIPQAYIAVTETIYPSYQDEAEATAN